MTVVTHGEDDRAILLVHAYVDGELDPANVIAFAQPSRIVFPEVDENEDLRRPTELDRLLQDLSQVEAEFARVAAYAIPTGAPSTT